MKLQVLAPGAPVVEPRPPQEVGAGESFAEALPPAAWVFPH